MKTQFIYFVDLDDFLVSYNFGETNKLSTATVASIEVFSEVHPIYSKDLDTIWKDPSEFINFCSPRLKYVIISINAKKGYTMGMGDSPFIKFDTAQLDHIHRITNMEYEFERIRRIINANLPSRLVCIYLAEDSPEGRYMVKQMFPYKPNFEIVPVKISHKILYHRADSQWVDEYFKTGNKKCIENYWKGIDFNSIPLYEHLLDGQIELCNVADKNKIKEDLKKRHPY